MKNILAKKLYKKISAGGIENENPFDMAAGTQRSDSKFGGGGSLSNLSLQKMPSELIVPKEFFETEFKIDPELMRMQTSSDILA